MVYIAKVKTKAANYDMLSASPAHGIVLWHNAPSLMVYSLCISKAVNLRSPRKNNLAGREAVTNIHHTCNSTYINIK